LGGKGKFKLETEEQPLIDNLGTQVELIQALIPLGLKAVGELLNQEVEKLAGPKHSRHGGEPGHYQWGSEWGYV
jgi:hypothetical protein